MATAGGLVFIGATSQGFSQSRHDEPVLRALDAKTGIELWRGRLSAGLDSSPMTFVGKSGRQYVMAVSSGRPDVDIALTAFAIPRPGEVPVDVHPAPMAKLAIAARPSAHVTVTRVADLPPGEGAADVVKVCTACHSLGTVTAAGRSRGGWSNVVEEMRGRGAKADDSTAARIVEYLAAHFAP